MLGGGGGVCADGAGRGSQAPESKRQTTRREANDFGCCNEHDMAVSSRLTGMIVRPRSEHFFAMNIYHIWCDLREGVDDLEFADAVQTYLGTLEEDGVLEHFRLTRRKLGLGHPA